MAGRGQLNQKIKDKSQELLGYEISQAELRLMPYVQQTMLDSQKLDPRRINDIEREILSSWREKGYIEGGASDMGISKQFWDAISEILWVGYVDYGHED